MTLYQILRRGPLFALFVLIALAVNIAGAQTQPVVYGIFFHSPTCPHCHIVMDEHWPDIDAEFGDQLRVLFVDASTSEGGQIMTTTRNALRIEARGVPMLIIGDAVMVGSAEIPARAPQVIRDGLAAGGIAPPTVPGITAIFEMVFGEIEADEALASIDGVGTTIERGDMLDDPANVMAIAVLGGLVLSLGGAAYGGWRTYQQGELTPARTLQGRLGWWLVLVGSVLGIGLSVTLLMGSFEDSLTLIISGAVLIIFAFFTSLWFKTRTIYHSQNWFVPLMLIAGLLVAGYLAYAEMTLDEMTCGAVGNCNAVQQSIYAQWFGVPVGVWGIVGYVLMLTVWWLGPLWDERQARIALFVMALFGVAASGYLTFLEPFVIGHSCAWCLTSAIIMMVLLWLVAPKGWQAISGVYR